MQEGDLVLVDAGARLDHYCSDCTRTFAVGDISDSLREIYDVTKEAQQAGLDAVRAGATGRDADAAARVVIADAGYGENFGHGLGHGLGLMVHEAPTLRPESSDTLEAGNVVTVEPGIYLSGVGGVRIEDLVAVTEDGCELLSAFPRTSRSSPSSSGGIAMLDGCTRSGISGSSHVPIRPRATVGSAGESARRSSLSPSSTRSGPSRCGSWRTRRSQIHTLGRVLLLDRPAADRVVANAEPGDNGRPDR